MKRSDDKPLSCRWCKKDICAGAVVVRTAAGPMHEGCYKEHVARRDEITDAAIREGRYTPGVIREFCGICRQWVSSIYYIGFDGTRMCPGCADRVAGQGPKSWEKQQRELKEKWERQRQKRTVTA